MTAGVSLDVIESYRHRQISHVAMDRRKCNTSLLPSKPRATPAAIGNLEDQHSKPVRDKGKVKKQDSDWSESFGKRQV